MQLKSSCHRQHGLSLVELMVGMAISLILLAGVVGLMLRITVAGGDAIKATRLNQQLRGSLDYMTRELQRAGHVDWQSAWDQCVDDSTPGVFDDGNGDGLVDMLDFYHCAVPAMDLFGKVELYDFPDPGDAGSGAASACEKDCDCVLYTYDLDGDGQLNTGPLFELFGFRWNGGAVEMRVGGDDPHSCTAGYWTDVSDANTKITWLGFSLEYTGTPDEEKTAAQYPIIGGKFSDMSATCMPGAGGIDDDKCLRRRAVKIELEGQLASDDQVSMQIETDIRVRNDHFAIKH